MTRRLPTARQRSTTFGALLDEVLGRGAALPPRVASPLLQKARAIAERERFFHWTLEFPEVFTQLEGDGPPSPGFDAVVVQSAVGDAPRPPRAREGAGLTEFARSSGIYASQGDGHANLFQLFLERGLMLVRSGGRVGFVLPSGFASDHGCAALRRHILQRTRVDTFVSIENRDGLFPIHRALKFLLMTASTDGASPALSCRFGVRSPDVLDDLPDVGVDPRAVSIPVALMAQISGEQYAVPELRTDRRPSRLQRASPSRSRRLCDSSGWHVAFGRELNATEDRRHFVEPGTGSQGPRATATTTRFSRVSRLRHSGSTWPRRVSGCLRTSHEHCSTRIALIAASSRVS